VVDVGLFADVDVAVELGVMEPESDTTEGSWVRLLQDNGIVLVPITSAEVPSDIGVPETVMPAPPGEIVFPSMARPLRVAVKASPSTVNMEALEGNVIVVVPMTRSEEPREIGVPDIVIPEPPGVRVVPAIGKPVGFAVKI